MRTMRIVFLTVLGTLFGAASAFSHHSFGAEFDVDKPVTLKGTITKVDFVNPHAWVYIDVKGADGKVVNWAIEFGAPNILIRNGMTKNSVPIGAVVTVEGFRAKDGTTTANGTSIRMPDGKQLFGGSSAPGFPGGERQ